MWCREGENRHVVAAAQAEAERNHLSGVIAVIDDGGWTILPLRMDNAAYVASVELAPGKARTAALFKKPSQALAPSITVGLRRSRRLGSSRCKAASQSSSMARSSAPIGASFDTPEHDVLIASAGLAGVTH
jgi:glc operon protein GlcG